MEESLHGSIAAARHATEVTPITQYRLHIKALDEQRCMAVHDATLGLLAGTGVEVLTHIPPAHRPAAGTGRTR